MTVNELLTKSSVLANMNDFSGASVDTSQIAYSLLALNMALNDINNDTNFATKTLTFDFNRDILPQDISDTQVSDEPADPDAPNEPDEPKPQTISDTYILPKGTRRIVRAFSNNTELQKTDFSSIIRMRKFGSPANMFAVNAGSLWLTMPLPIVITYVPEIPDLAPGDEIDIEPEYLPYLIHRVAWQIAVSFNTNTAETCQRLMDTSYTELMNNKRYETGYQFVNPYTSFNRFNNGMFY